MFIDIKSKPVSLFAETVLLYYSSVIQQGKRNDLSVNEKNVSKNGIKKCAEVFGISERQVSRYIRVPNCYKEVLERLDKKEISLRAAVELSYLDKNKQKKVIDIYDNKTAKSHF